MFTNLLNKTAQIQSRSDVQNDIGETTAQWTTYATLPCRYEKNSAPSVFEGEYKTTLKDFIFFFDAGVDIKTSDRILVDGKYFEVFASFNVDGRLKPHVEVFARLSDNAEANA